MRKPYHRPGGRFSQLTQAAGKQRRLRTFGIMLIFSPAAGSWRRRSVAHEFLGSRASRGGYRVTVSLFRFTTAARVWSTDDRP